MLGLLLTLLLAVLGMLPNAHMRSDNLRAADLAQRA
jgi:hypothetical protein